MATAIKIAIDGYSSCGKSTLAKDLAKKLNYIFIDTGAMYRAVTLAAIQNNIIKEDDKVDEDTLNKLLPTIQIRFNNINGKIRTYLNGEDVEDIIRQKEVSNLVSIIASLGSVRTKLVNQQREIGNKGGVVMDGRDIGTVVFPDAELKLFVTASMDTRTERRYSELISKGIEISRDEVTQNLAKRDHLDSTRKISPLKKADDAIVIDNSNLTREEQLDVALGLVQERSKTTETF